MKARLFISIGWLISNLHRAWNNSMPVSVYPFPLWNEFPLTVQWYVYLLGVKLFPAFILMAAYCGIWTKDFKFIQAVLWLEVLNYLIWYSTNEIILFIQGTILAIMYIKKWK